MKFHHFWSLKVGLDSSHSEGKQCMKTWYKKLVFTKGNDVMDNNRISIRQFSPIFGSTIDHPQGPAYTYKLWRGHARYKDVLFRCDENLMTIWWKNAFIIWHHFLTFKGSGFRVQIDELSAVRETEKQAVFKTRAGCSYKEFYHPAVRWLKVIINQ